MGRPSKRTPEIIQSILDGLSKGTPLTVVCHGDEMPNPATVWKWEQDDAELKQAIAHARELGFDVIAQDALDIADNTANDTKKGADGRDVPDNEWITRSRLRVDTRLKLLAKWDPKRYGDKVDVNHGGNVGLTLNILPDDASL